MRQQSAFVSPKILARVGGRGCPVKFLSHITENFVSRAECARVGYVPKFFFTEAGTQEPRPLGLAGAWLTPRNSLRYTPFLYTGIIIALVQSSGT